MHVISYRFNSKREYRYKSVEEVEAAFLVKTSLVLERG